MRRLLGLIAREMREAIPAFLFFCAVFGVSRLTLALVLEEHHLTVGGTAVAAVGALLVAKAILLADALPFTDAFAKRRLVYSIVWKSLIYGVITLAFRYLEELFRLSRKYGSAGAAGEKMLEEVSWPHFWAVQIWIAFALLGYCAAVELVRALGKDEARALFFGARAQTD